MAKSTAMMKDVCRLSPVYIFMSSKKTLHEIRMETGESIQDFANRVHASETAVLTWEMQDCGTSPDICKKIARAYGLPLEEVLRRQPSDRYNTSAAQKLRQCRLEKHYSQKLVTDATGVEASTIVSAERSILPIRYKGLSTLCQFYGITVDDLFTPDENESPALPDLRKYNQRGRPTVNLVALRYYRKQRGLTAADVAAALSVSSGTYYAWERGVTYVPPRYIDALAALLKIDPAELILPATPDIELPASTLPLHEFLKKARIRKGIRQVDASKILKLPVARISAIETGRIVPSEEILRKMEELYGVQYTPEKEKEGSGEE